MSSTVRLIGCDGRGQGSLTSWPSWYDAPNSKREVSLKNEPFHFYEITLFGMAYGERPQSYLNPVEDLVYVLVDDADLTSWTEREAVQTTEQRVRNAAILTGRRLIPQVQRFVLDKLVGKLLPVLEPLLKV